MKFEDYLEYIHKKTALFEHLIEIDNNDPLYIFTKPRCEYYVGYLKELAEKLKYRVKDGADTKTVLWEILDAKYEAAVNSDSFDKTYYSYDYGHPSAYYPSMANTTVWTLCDIIRADLQFYDRSPVGILDFLQGRFDDNEYNNYYRILAVRDFFDTKLDEDEKEELAAMCKRAETLIFMRKRFNWKLTEVDKVLFITDEEYTGENLIDQAEFWGDFYAPIAGYESLVKDYIMEGYGDEPVISQKGAENAFQLAEWLVKDRFRPISAKKASYYYRCAAEAGHIEAMYRLGQCFRYGEGGEQPNPERAVMWFEAAAEKGHKQAASLVKKYRGLRGAEKMMSEVYKYRRSKIKKI